MYSLIGERFKTFNFLWKALPANKTLLGTPRAPPKFSLCYNLTSMTSRMNLLPFSMLLTLFRASTCSENEPWQAKTPTLMILQLEVKIFFSVLIIFSLNLNWNVIFDWTWIFHNTIHVPTNQNWFLQFFRHLLFSKCCHNWGRIEFRKCGRWGDECASIVQGRTNSEIMFVHNFSLYRSQCLYKVFSVEVISNHK